jgi:hypothetical protein
MNEHSFVKGYVPISFFSSLPISGYKLTEVFFGSNYIATGWMIHCTYPDLNNGDVRGSFYFRSPESVSTTFDICDFYMEQGRITQKGGGFTKIVPDNAIIGINVTSFPTKMRNLSINLLGTFPGAGSFNRIPKDYSFYIKEPESGVYGVEEKFTHYKTELTGLSISCSESGVGSNYPYYDYDETIGYVSLSPKSGLYSGSFTGLSFSGDFMTGRRIVANNVSANFNYYSGFVSGVTGENFAFTGTAQYLYGYGSGYFSGSGFSINSGTMENFRLTSGAFSGVFSGEGVGRFIYGPNLHFNNYPFSGNLYKKTTSGSKIDIVKFKLDSGEYFSNDIPISGSLENKERLGIDIYTTVSGMKGVMISALGYLY